MTNFDEIQALWAGQDGPKANSSDTEKLIELAEMESKKIKERQRWTIGILGVSIILLALYIIAYAGMQLSLFNAGVSLMALSLLLRLALEYLSNMSFRRIDIESDFSNYTKRITRFYVYRMKIHYVITPVLAGTYITGFILLLSVFKKSFSSGFFWYIVLSGLVLVILFAWMVAGQVKKEIELLGLLKEIC